MYTGTETGPDNKNTAPSPVCLTVQNGKNQHKVISLIFRQRGVRLDIAVCAVNCIKRMTDCQCFCTQF